MGAYTNVSIIKNKKEMRIMIDTTKICRYCGEPTIRTIPKRKKLKPDQKYYFLYYYKCTDYPNCKGIFHVENAKVWTGE